MSIRLTRKNEQIRAPSVLRGHSPVPAIETLVGSLENNWTISADIGRLLSKLVVRERRGNVLEFGAGISSLVFSKSLAEIGGGSLTSVEENPSWCANVWQEVQSFETVDSRLIASKVALRVDSRGLYYRYVDIEPIRERGLFDLVFIDAPFGGVGRDGGLYAALDNIAVGGLIVLDDAARVSEQRTLRRWLLNCSNLALVTNDFSLGRGVSILEKQAADRVPVPAWARLAETWGSSFYETVRRRRQVRYHRKNTRNIKQAK